MASAKVSTEDYVTIVSVGNSEVENKIIETNNEIVNETPFVTVLSIGNAPVEEEVTIYRLPGEKLGFGLKFEGGTKSAECVRRLFIQSCSADSPAGRARAVWGPLEAGDEILRIDNFPVTSLTRLECVRCLKDSNVAVSLLVRHDIANKFESDENIENVRNRTYSNGEKFCDASALPPPVPPRKIHRKNFKDADSNKLSKSSENISKSSESVVVENGLKKGSTKSSPSRPRKSIQAPSPPPPEAQVYTDLFSNEKENGLHIAESESDDTGSSISTVIDRLSIYSSFSGSVENSIPSTPTLGTKQLNFQNVFSCLDSIGQSLLADMPPSIVEEKMKISKPGLNASQEKLALVKSKSNASEDSLPFENGVSMSKNSTEKFNDIDENIDSNKSFAYKDSNNNKKPTQTNCPKALVNGSEDLVDGCIESTKKPAIIETPKPKPRTINKKNIENTFGQRKYDENLSLTKIHCIESWLQDSISCKITHDSSSDIRDEDHEIRPEALPRLIDFVPKSTKQTSSCDTQEKTPPRQKEGTAVDMEQNDLNNLKLVVTRDPTEEWCSSAGSPQLETIYEDLSCPTLLIEESSRHPPAGDSGSDQGNNPSLDDSHASVVEVILPESIINNDESIETSPPAKADDESEECAGVAVTRGPRSPPDGRENPAIHHEDASPPLPPTVYENIKFHSEVLKLPTQPSKSIEIKEVVTNERLKKDESVLNYQTMLQQTPKKTVKDWEKKFTRGKDEKSNGSVKDKIAMFSSSKFSPPEPPFNEKKNGVANKTERNSLNSPTVSRSVSLQMEPITKQYGTYDRNASSKKINTIDFAGTLPRANSDKNNSSILYKRTLSYDANNESRANAHKNTLNQLIEQRRQSMNKLRGLVIPDSPRVLNLPEIKSKDSFDLNLSSLRDNDDVINNKKGDTVRMTMPSVPSWETQPVVTNIPKYSPAFKRKSLQIYGPKSTREQNGNSVSSMNNSNDVKHQIPLKPPRTSLDTKKSFECSITPNRTQTLPSSYKSFHLYSNQANFGKSPEVSLSENKDTVDSPSYKSQKIFSDTLDSDNDSSYLSTVSSPTPSLNTVDNTESDCSSQSAVSQSNEKHFLKNGSLYDYSSSMYGQENGKSDVCRSLSSDTSTSGGSSNSSTLTSGSQASCSSAGSTDTGSRILKPRSIEAINRKNILASAKCRSGKDKYGSPLIERKFSDVESTDDDTTVKMESHTKPRNDSVSNPIMRVAYSTLVVDDKFSQNETDTTCSDDSDCDYGNVTMNKTELSHRYSNGSTASNANKIPMKDANRVSNANNLVKSHVAQKNKPIEKIDTFTTVEIKTNSVTVNKNINGNGNCNGVTKKTSESDIIDVSSGCVSEDEQDNLCEVKLSRGASGGVGVTLAGGSDCEAKEVTIHKVLQGSAAERDGRLHKGDRVISINGHSMKNITHAQSVAILKEQLPEVSIIISSKRKEANLSSDANKTETPVVSVVLNKSDDNMASAGLGISLLGGGIAPLIINRLFTGSVAANSGKIPIGCELLAIGETPLTGYTRTQAWGLLRALPAGPVTLVLRPP